VTSIRFIDDFMANHPVLATGILLFIVALVALAPVDGPIGLRDSSINPLQWWDYLILLGLLLVGVFISHTDEKSDVPAESDIQP